VGVKTSLVVLVIVACLVYGCLVVHGWQTACGKRGGVMSSDGVCFARSAVLMPR
jgi:hypothetical protein